MPEPVFVSADQLTGALVKALLDGPGPELAEVVRTFVPQGLTPGCPCPSTMTAWPPSPSRATPRALTPETAKLLVYQFAWTLKQVPELTAFRITIGGEPVTMPGGSSSQFSVDLGSEYDPTDVQASNQLFAVDSGSLVTGDPTDLQPVTGPFGTYGGIESVGVGLDAQQAAAVTDDGTTVVVAPVAARGTGRRRSRRCSAGRPSSSVRRGTSSGCGSSTGPPTALRSACWTPTRDWSPRRSPSTGITGRQVRDFIVSRDGTRLRGRRPGDGGRPAADQPDPADFGRVVGATPSRQLGVERRRDRADPGHRLAHPDHAWGCCTPQSRQFTRFASVSVDGADGPQLPEQTVLQNVATDVVSSPAESEPWYADRRLTS